MSFLRIISIIAIIFLVLVSYWDLPKTFFQQDEWWTFGLYNKREDLGGLLFILKDMVITSGKVHFTPFSELGFYLEYKLFGLNFSPYAFISIFIHLSNTVLVYIFIKQVVKNKFIAILSSLFFAINSISHQGVSWVATSINTQGMTFFTLLSLIFFMRHIRYAKQYKNYLYLSYLFIVIALLFKETIMPFLILPVIYVLYGKDKNFYFFVKKTFMPFIIFLIFYLLIRLIVFVSAEPILGSGNVELVQAEVFEYVYRLFALPFRVIAQSLVPPDILLLLSEIMARLSYPQFVYSDNAVDPYIRETIGYDVVCFFITVIVMSFSFFSYKYFKKKNENFSKGIILFSLITFFSAMLIIFIPGKAGFVSLIEPRHLYSGSFGSSGLMVLALFGIFSYLVQNKAKLLVTAILIPIITIHILIIRNDINQLESMGFTRKNILSTIKNDYPKLPKKVLFYTKSDTAYYGMPDEEKTLPVQVGFGWMLMVWYHEKENFPPCLYDVKLFLPILVQTYKECKGRGFGYFRDYDKLVKSVLENNLNPESVIAYSWTHKHKDFKDITKQVREKLKKEIRILNEIKE